MKGLTLKEAAKKANVTTQRIHQLAAAGRLGFTQTPYGRLFNETDIARYAQEHKKYERRLKARSKKKKRAVA